MPNLAEIGITAWKCTEIKRTNTLFCKERDVVEMAL
jgi:hypothetical protein